MIQPVALQKVRVPAVAIGAFALGVVAAASLSRIGAAPQVIQVQVPSTFSQRPLVQVQTDNAACGAGAYVSGDLAGDANPAAIYAAMCGPKR